MIKRHLFISKTWLLLGLIAMAGGSKSPQPSPRDILQRFCELDAAGKQLTSAGAQEIATLFVQPGSPQQDKVIVIRDFVVSQPSFTDKKAEFYVEYIYLGQIDLSHLQFSRLPSDFPSGPSKVRSAFTLLSAATTIPAGAGGPSSAPDAASEWRIAGSPPEPHLTISAAVSYIKQMRDKTTDAAVRKNAEKTLVALSRLR
jgi:hypothetical protein